MRIVNCGGALCGPRGSANIPDGRGKRRNLGCMFWVDSIRGAIRDHRTSTYTSFLGHITGSYVRLRLLRRTNEERQGAISILTAASA